MGDGTLIHRDDGNVGFGMIGANTVVQGIFTYVAANDATAREISIRFQRVSNFTTNLLTSNFVLEQTDVGGNSLGLHVPFVMVADSTSDYAIVSVYCTRNNTGPANSNTKVTLWPVY